MFLHCCACSSACKKQKQQRRDFCAAQQLCTAARRQCRQSWYSSRSGSSAKPRQIWRMHTQTQAQAKKLSVGIQRDCRASERASLPGDKLPRRLLQGRIGRPCRAGRATSGWKLPQRRRTRCWDAGCSEYPSRPSSHRVLGHIYAAESAANSAADTCQEQGLTRGVL